MTDMTSVYDLCYSQNGCPANNGPTLMTVWSERKAKRIADKAGDLAIVERIVTVFWAEKNAE